MNDKNERMVDSCVDETSSFLSKMSVQPSRLLSDESDDGGGHTVFAETDPLAIRPRNEKASTKPKNGPRCSVMYCKNKKDDGCDPDISFHRFPKSPAMQRIWAKRTRPPLTSNLQNRFVCAIHFDAEVTKGRSQKDSKRRLKRSAIPTLHLPPPEDEEGCELVLPSDQEPSSELDLTSEPEGDVEDNELDVPQEEMDPSRDIEMVELSSDDDDVEEVAAAVSSIQGLTSADALAATSALQLPTRPTCAPVAKTPRKSVGIEKSPSKSVLSMDGSMDGSSFHSDEEGDDDDIVLVPSEELDYMELQNPLEKAYAPATWKTMNEKARRAALRSYFSRIASYLPVRFPRNSKMAILESATQYLDEVTKSNAILAIEEEILLQKHYRLRNVKRKLEQKALRRC